MKALVLAVVLLVAPFIVFAVELPVVCQEFPPYNFLDDKGRVSGSSVEIVTDVLQRMGFEANIRLLPLNRAYREAADGHAALLVTFAKNPEREEALFFTDVLAALPFPGGTCRTSVPRRPGRKAGSGLRFCSFSPLQGVIALPNLYS